MKILFGVLAGGSVLVSLFCSFVCYMGYGLDLAGSAIGEAVCIVGMLSVAVGIAGVVLGILSLRRGSKKRAVLFALLGVIFAAVVVGGMLIDEAVSSVRYAQDVAERMEETYGEDWDSDSAIEGIPELYQEVLNQLYVAVRDRWPADELMDLGVVAMADYYGEVSTENIGFALKDLNCDGVDELVVGTVIPAEKGGTVVFCIYTDPENPFYAINSVEGDAYYLHAGETEGAYVAEFCEEAFAWVIVPAQAENTFDFTAWEGTMDPAGRMELDLIPFSQYK